MTLVADTGGLYALYDRNDRHHETTRAAFESYPGRVVVPLPVVTELDYFLTRHLGTDASLEFLTSISIGAFTLDHLEPPDLPRIAKRMKRYADLSLGFVDACVITVAERLRTTKILTVDLRDFRAVGRHDIGPLELWPADLI